MKKAIGDRREARGKFEISNLKFEISRKAEGWRMKRNDENQTM
jgi:hypothetical protein